MEREAIPWLAASAALELVYFFTLTAAYQRAALIAGYTLVDAEGIQHAEPVPYLLLALVPTALGAAAVCGPARLRVELRPTTVLAGCGGYLAYVLVLAALRLAPAAPVAAVREASVLIAVALAAPFLGEAVTRMRLAGAALVVAGIVILGTA